MKAIGWGWLCLAATSLQAQAAPLPRLSLHHLQFVLDSATYHDVAASPFWASQFSGRVDRTSANGALNCAGMCLIGRHTYLELLAPGDAPHARVGDAGITLTSEEGGGVGALIERFRADQRAVDSAARQAKLTSTMLAWQPAGTDSLTDRLSLWVVEYTLAAAQQAKVVDSLPDSDRSRDRFLVPFLSKDQLFAELTAATIAVPVEAIAKIGNTLTRLGVTVMAEGEGAVIQLPGFTMRLLPAWNRPGVRKLEFSLNREALANPTYRFGPSSRLRFGPGRVAVWEF